MSATICRELGREGEARPAPGCTLWGQPCGQLCTEGLAAEVDTRKSLQTLGFLAPSMWTSIRVHSRATT